MATFNKIYLTDILSTGNRNINLSPNGIGEVIVLNNPITAKAVATKEYVDTQVSASILKITPITTSTYNILNTDTILSCRYSTVGPQILTLPLVSTITIGKVYHIVDTYGNAQVHNITINTSGVDKVNGQNAILLNGNYQSFSIYADSNNKWFVF